MTQIESEAVMKVFFADQGGPDELRRTIEGMRANAQAAVDRLSSFAADALDGESPFPERLSTTMFPMRLISELHRTIYDWTGWMADELDVLESGDEQAIATHTTATARQIRDQGSWGR